MSDWHSSGFGNEDLDEFLSACDELLSEIDDLPEAAEDFADSVREKVTNMRSWAETNQRCTEKMLGAVRSMAEGVGRWQRD
jgi:uncharacterized protein YoxC